MRRYLAASMMGLLLTTGTAFAADDKNEQAPALNLTAAVAAAAASTTAANTADPAAVDFTSRSSFKWGRPAVLPSLYATSAALQGYDAYSTLAALNAGAREANPLMKGVVKSPTAFVAMKAGVTAMSIMAAERLWKNNHRMGAIGLMVASNVMMGLVAANNHRVLSNLR